jgi:hypothetical protein
MAVIFTEAAIQILGQWRDAHQPISAIGNGLFFNAGIVTDVEVDSVTFLADGASQKLSFLPGHMNPTQGWDYYETDDKKQQNLSLFYALPDVNAQVNLTADL